MSSSEIRVDHDEAIRVATELEEYAEAYRKDIAKKKEATITAMRQESSQNTRDGSPAPIFRDVNEALTKLMERVETQVDAICEQLEHDTEAIRRLSSESKEAEDIAAQGLNNVDTNVQD